MSLETVAAIALFVGWLCSLALAFATGRLVQISAAAKGRKALLDDVLTFIEGVKNELSGNKLARAEPEPAEENEPGKA